jgi:uridine kinase
MSLDYTEISSIKDLESKLERIENHKFTCSADNSKENNCNIKFNKKKVIVIGIGGITRAGKSTLRKFLVERINPIGMFHVDDFLINPIKKWDEKIQEYIEDWEDPVGHDLESMHKEMKALKELAINSLDTESQDVKFMVAEGFLLYNRKEIADLIDVKISFVIDKELCRERRKNTKFYGSDYYFDEYIWRCYHLNK